MPQSTATKVAKAEARVREEAQETDLRRQAQIANQVEIINRLMEDGSFDVHAHLSERLASTEVMLAQARAEISRLRAEQEVE